MTIGIGASGPNAGLAVFEALRAAELVGRGAIGGFATYAALTAEGKLLRYETQRGGSRTLFTEGEQTGINPPLQVQEAIAAAVISSGPDRPVPLAQFLVADPKGGLVTGHRLPNTQSVDGQAVNLEVLAHLMQGGSAQAAVDRVLDRNPQADVGMIAIDRQGIVYGRNSDRVAQRPDLGYAHRSDRGTGAAVTVLHNAIRPAPSLADVVADIALDVMRGDRHLQGWVTIPAGIPVILGKENTVVVDPAGMATQVFTTDPLLVHGEHIGSAIYLHSIVQQGDRTLGKTLFEPICTVKDAHLVEMSGQRLIRMSYGLTEPG